jgi:hypothetical protein
VSCGACEGSLFKRESHIYYWYTMEEAKVENLPIISSIQKIALYETKAVSV